jgi:hypothetical protein
MDSPLIINEIIKEKNRDTEIFPREDDHDLESGEQISKMAGC